MTWFRLDDKSHSHPKVITAGNAAWGLYARCGAWCADQLTDGKIPKNVAKIFGKPSEVRALLAAGLWAEDGAFYVMPDYLEYNPSRQRVEGDRASARERMSRRRSGEQAPNEQVNFALGSASPNPTPTPITKVTTQHQVFLGDTDGVVELSASRNQVALAAAERLFAQADKQKITNPAGWQHTVAQRLLRSHGHDIDRALEMGLAIDAIAERVARPDMTEGDTGRRLTSARAYAAAVAEAHLASGTVDLAAFGDEVVGWDHAEREVAVAEYATRTGTNVVEMRRSNV